MTPMRRPFINELCFNENGLIPAIAQDWLDGAVLMMAWMNENSLEATLNTGEVHYWSRSRKELWRKGATSGHTQILKDIRYDCDADVLLLIIEQIGTSACHMGSRSCFFNQIIKETKTKNLIPPSDVCSELFKVIEERELNPQDESYTNSLLKEGENKILKKLGEEHAEFIMACKDNDPYAISNEAADLIFHLQVALKTYNVQWKDVLEVLVKRKGKRRKINE
tara:strand:- start:3298 stop:3966 length:669 start_codon:yes stop_codon:yes gene_type:complete